MKIDSVGDIDWYGFPVDGQGYVQVRTKKSPDNLNLRVRFAQKQAWKSTKHKWITGSHPVPYTMAVHEPDTLYFAVYDHHDRDASDEEIVFKADFIKEFDQYEPNDEPDSAITIQPGEVMHTYFFPKSDVDWFKAKVDSAGYLMVKARSIPGNISPRVRFAKKKDEFSQPEEITGSLNLPAGLQVAEPGYYYFSFYDHHNRDVSREAVEWKIDYIEEMDSTEANNSFEEAFPLAVNDTVSVAIFPKGDVDVFALNPNFSVTVRVAAKAPDNITPVIRLYVVKDFEENSGTGWERLPRQLELEGGKKYYIKLKDRHDRDYSKEPIIFSVTDVSENNSD